MAEEGQEAEVAAVGVAAEDSALQVADPVALQVDNEVLDSVDHPMVGRKVLDLQVVAPPVEDRKVLVDHPVVDLQEVEDQGTEEESNSILWLELISNACH